MSFGKPSATYAGSKGKAPASSLKPEARKALRPLSEAQQAAVAGNKAFVETHLPEVVGCIKDLYAEGLIDGWRSVTHCHLLQGE